MASRQRSDYEIGKTIVYFIRHGDRLETSDNSRHPGPGLSPKGIKEAKYVAKQFLKIHDHIDAIYSSDMTRAVETAKEISKATHKKVVFCKELSEFNKFLWERKVHHIKFWKHYLKYKSAQRCFDKILEDNKGKTIIIVAHGNVIKGLVGNKMNIDFRKRGLMQYDNCHITKIRFKDKKFDYMTCYNSKILQQH